MKFIASCCCALAVMSASAEVPDCYVRMTVTEYTNLVSQVATLWTAHTNALAYVEARKAATAERKSAIDRVRENAKKRKRSSVMPKSAGGVK